MHPIHKTPRKHTLTRHTMSPLLMAGVGASTAAHTCRECAQPPSHQLPYHRPQPPANANVSANSNVNQQ